MSARRVVDPVWEVHCDRYGCATTFRGGGRWDKLSENNARLAAQKAGWLTRPFKGKGSRSAPDFCPAHRGGRDEGGGPR
jgi:hypothetical protein